MSDRANAKAAGVSHPTIAKVRQEATGKDLPVARKRLDGKTRRMPESARNQVLDLFKTGNVMTTDEVRVELPDINPQTVNSAVNGLAKDRFLVDTGKRKATRSNGSRKAIGMKAGRNAAGAVSGAF